MKVEANQILREKGASALRGVMDAAHPFNGHNATSDEPTPHTEYPESADGEPDHGSSGRGREGVSLNDFHA
jgi:hypothetical protein